MCIKIKNNIKVFKLSDDAISFIRTYLIEECNVTTKIDMDIFDDFIAIAFDWETAMVDENGHDRTNNYQHKERNEMADKFVSEVSGKLSTGLCVPDFDDLNKKLGLA